MEIEEPVKELVFQLRNLGFNTIFSCGHLPQPYIDMEWYEDGDITKIYNFLIENNYKDFDIVATWYCLKGAFGEHKEKQRILSIKFAYIIPRRLATKKEIKCLKKKTE